MSAQDLINILYRKGAAITVENGELLIHASSDLLDSDTLQLLKKFKIEIIALLSKLDREDICSAPFKQSYPKSYHAPASLAQQRILFMEELNEDGSRYNIPVAYNIRGHLNKNALSRSLSRLMERHDVLRTKYILKDNVYIQSVTQPAPFNICEKSIIHEYDKAAALKNILDVEGRYQFDLNNEWPIRVCLIALEEHHYVLSINIHHIAADGWSARNIINEINIGYKFYSDECQQNAFIEVERDFQYADYVFWQEAWQASRHYEDAKSYWLTELKGAPELHSLPIDYIRPKTQSISGSSFRYTLPQSCSQKLDILARAHHTTAFIVFQSVFTIFLSRYSGESDIVFGVAAANRQPLEFLNTVGLFVNTLVMRHTIPDNISFIDLIKKVSGKSERALRFQQLPFDALVNEIRPARSLGYNPLVQIMLVMQENTANNLTLAGLEVTRIDQLSSVSKFDLTLHVHFSQEKWVLEWEYNTDLFKASTIQSMATLFERLLDSYLSSPEADVNSIPLIDSKSYIPSLNLHQFPAPRCAHLLFEEQATRYPYHIAVRDGDKILTYKELNIRANQLAAHIYETYNGNVGRIGLCMEKSLELIVGLIAIFKLGAVYVPLDPGYPNERLHWMIQDSCINVLISASSVSFTDAHKFSVPVLLVDSLSIASRCRSLPAVDVNSSAYIIYTSGSTGKPKGVLVSHLSLFYSLHANQQLMLMGSTDVMPTIGSQAFGLSLLEVLLPLISGGAVQIVKKSHVIDIEKLIKTTENVTVLHAVPSLMRRWIEVLSSSHIDECLYPKLRLLLVGGEAVPNELLNKIKVWRPDIRLLELYGMTESAVVCSSYDTVHQVNANCCIGKPHPNSCFLVLNRYGQQQPAGVPGELHIGGFSLATEYINQPKLTSEKFMFNPYFGMRLYKTGDFVRLLDDGNYEYLGRMDHQVSLRGARIELGEIETVASNIAGVTQAVAHVADVGEHEKTLVLYYTYDANYQDLNEIIKNYLSEHLPDYMRPSIIYSLELFPLNPNGKVDRNRLPKPKLLQLVSEPQNDIERRLMHLWQADMQLDSISVDSNFFEIGGHSLLATKLTLAMRSTFGISIPLTVIFELKNIRSCARYIENALKEKYAKDLIVLDQSDHPNGDEELFL